MGLFVFSRPIELWAFTDEETGGMSFLSPWCKKVADRWAALGNLFFVSETWHDAALSCRLMT